MPLPAQDQTWPPQELQTIYRDYAIADAWYAGDTAKLHELYANPANQGGPGWFGGLRRWFHGTPTPKNQTQPPVKLHLPIPAEVARMSSAQVYGEMFDVRFEDPDAPTPDGDDDADDQPQADPHADLNRRVDDLLDDNAHARFLEGGEFQSAHGGVFLKIAWDKVLHPQGPFLVTVPVDAAIPEFRYGILTAVTFWTRLPQLEDGHYLLLERHEPGTIEYGLYASNATDRLGNLVPLKQHPNAASLADIVDENAQVATGSPLLAAQYLPNLGPNKKWRKDPSGRYLGRSDFDGAYDLFDSADEALTSYMRDLRLGKARLTVPRSMITVGKPGEGATFNADQEIFLGLDGMDGSLNPEATQGGAQPAKVELFQPELRGEEHRQTIEHLREAAVQACGYSPQTFGSAVDVAITATETVAREKLTVLTRGSKILSSRPPLALLIAALVDIDAEVFDGPGRPDGLLPTLEWPDAASDSPQATAEFLQKLNLAEAISLWRKVEVLNPDWDDQQIGEEVDRIRKDLSQMPIPSERTLWTAEGGEPTPPGGAGPVTAEEPTDGGAADTGTA